MDNEIKIYSKIEAMSRLSEFIAITENVIKFFSDSENEKNIAQMARDLKAQLSAKYKYLETGMYMRPAGIYAMGPSDRAFQLYKSIQNYSKSNNVTIECDGENLVDSAYEMSITLRGGKYSTQELAVIVSEA